MLRPSLFFALISPVVGIKERVEVLVDGSMIREADGLKIAGPIPTVSDTSVSDETVTGPASIIPNTVKSQTKRKFLASIPIIFKVMIFWWCALLLGVSAVVFVDYVFHR